MPLCQVTQTWKTRLKQLCLVIVSVTILGVYVHRTAFSFSEFQMQNQSKLDGRQHEYSWIENAETIDVNERDVLRCESLDLGCFTLSRRRRNYEEMHLPQTSNTTASWLRTLCLSKCFERKLTTVAGYHESNGTCYCSSAFWGFVATRDLTAYTSSDLAKNCSAQSSVRVHRKTHGCERGVSEDYMKRSMLLHAEVPVARIRTMKSYKLSNFTSEQCVLLCESKGFLLAMPVQRIYACVCSDLSSMFSSPEYMQKAMHEYAIFTNTTRERQIAPVYQTLERDPLCQPTMFLRPGEIGRTVLASFPGSGNTWLRQLIEIATGYYTGSAYTDPGLVNGGLVGESIEKTMGMYRVIAVKDHIFNLKLRSLYESAILLVRNPYDAAISEFSRMATKSHTGTIGNDRYKSEEFRRFAHSSLAQWYAVARTVVENVNSVLVVYYEKLLEDPVGEMRCIVDFLPKELTRTSKDHLDRRLMCMNLNLKGNFKRRRRKLPFNPFDSFMKTTIEICVKNFALLMANHRHPPMPTSYHRCGKCG